MSNDGRCDQAVDQQAGLSARRWAILQELRDRGSARSREIAAALGLTPATVGYVMHQLCRQGCIDRISTGFYEFVRIPDGLHFWAHEQHLADIRPAEGCSLPEKVLSLFRQSPEGMLSFRAVWQLSGLGRRVVGAVLSGLVSRERLRRVRRGLYQLPKSEDVPM